MASNRFTKKNVAQLTLLITGIMLVFFIYFFGPKQKQLEEVNISETKKIKEEKKGVTVFENLEYKGTDSNGNKFVIFSEYSDFNQEKPEIIKMEKMLCYFYFKDGTVLQISSQKGVYNNVTLDISFAENVKMFYEGSSLFSDKADFSNEDNQLFIEGNVKTKSPNGDLIADKLNFDFSDKKLKVSMYNNNNDKVNIKTKIR